MSRKLSPRVSLSDHKKPVGKLSPHESLEGSSYIGSSLTRENMEQSFVTSGSDIRTSLNALVGSSASDGISDRNTNINRQIRAGQTKRLNPLRDDVARNAALMHGDQRREVSGYSAVKGTFHSENDGGSNRLLELSPREPKVEEVLDSECVHDINTSVPTLKLASLSDSTQVIPSPGPESTLTIEGQENRSDLVGNTSGEPAETERKPDEATYLKYPSTKATVGSISPGRAAMGVCDSCRLDVPFGQSNDYLVSIELPNLMPGVQGQWGLVHPTPVPFRATSPSGEAIDTTGPLKPPQGRHSLSRGDNVPSHPGWITPHRGLPEFLGDTGVDIQQLSKYLIPDLGESERATRDDYLDDSVFPVGHSLGTSEGLRQAMEKVRADERRRSYRKVPLKKAEYIRHQGSLVSCHNRFPHNTKAELHQRYRRLASQVNRSLFNDWHNETTARAAYVEPPLTEKQTPGRAFANQDVAGQKHNTKNPPKMGCMEAMLYGKSRFNPGKILTNKPTPPMPPFASAMYSPSGKSKTAPSAVETGFPTGLTALNTLKTPKSILKNVSLASSDHSQHPMIPVEDHNKSWPCYPRDLHTRRVQQKSRKDHPSKCICEACTKAAQWIHTMGFSCYSGNEALMAGDTEDRKSSKGSKGSVPESDITALSGDPIFTSHEGVSPKILQVQPVVNDSLRAWEIQKLEDMLRHKTLEQAKRMGIAPKPNFGSSSV